MSGRLRRRARAYLGVLQMVPKLYTAYRIWFWMDVFVHTLSLVIFVYFWRAVYGGREVLGGLELRQTLDYIMWAQVAVPVVHGNLVYHVGRQLVEGQFAMELLRPLDLQARYYIDSVGLVLLSLVQRIPVALLAWWLFGLTLPADPAVWVAFLISLLIGSAVMFCFEWIFCCLAFYTTETWGLGMVQQSFATFFSGALIPLVLMPDWLERVALSLPFAQALWVPVSILSGITPLADVPRLWIIQLLWLLGMILLSRLLFRVAVRQVTIQGG